MVSTLLLTFDEHGGSCVLDFAELFHCQKRNHYPFSYHKIQKGASSTNKTSISAPTHTPQQKIKDVPQEQAR
jgi:hypothetical protein